MQETIFGDYRWIHLDMDNRPDPQSIPQEIDHEILNYALDENERAFMEYTADTDSLTLVFNVLDLVQDDGYYETVPMTFVLRGKQVISMTNKRSAYVYQILADYLTSHPNVSAKTFLFAGLTLLTKKYFQAVDQIDHEKDVLNRKLRQQTSKKKLLAMSDLETGSVYLLAASNQNVLLLEQLESHYSQRNNSDVEKEQLTDALIEARQLVSMTQLNSQILAQLSSSFNNVLNNNLNDNLTALNVISINLAILACITGFFGMNIPLPFTDKEHTWLFLCLISILIWFTVARLLMNFVRNKR
ncbi:magnesium transporter CorA family protein [Streptococcus gallinaceus]|uniref:Mg2+ and Co2+ transporter CorA n=1 Tax=Streptococcus gallinaceus TaxID=165758 RepID=A0ABV2JI37_9STRE|nr:magnesium transporter CorA family protein [Streptococcus gallinaceus]MCP1638426.1 Mg2+ and Co2+ transporter CorA [Streptococcus gallinaceus]MCP1769487.1 Mg2+ and Co2+ transporter CorA [Streptococcus gallinaceus]